MSRTMRLFTAASLLAMFALFFSAAPALAHGHTEVGDYELVIGFRSEPAYQGEPNGLDLRVTNHETKQPVTGLEDKIRAEIIFGASRREVEIRPQFGQEGAYTADVLPTEAGDYTWHIWGDLGGTPLDVSMTSSPDTFNPVQPKGNVAFPEPEPTAAELRAQVEAAQQAAQTALMVGIGGAVLGLAGIVAGVMGWRARQSAAGSAETARRPL